MIRPLGFLAALSLFAALPASLFVAGCQRPEDGKVENVISFDRIADSLKPFDEVVIVLKSLDGDTVDVVFRGKVIDAEDVRRLKAPHWDGGRIVVAITGSIGGRVVYQVDTRFDPAADTRDNIVVFVSPEASLVSTVQGLTLLVGDSVAYPPVTAAPPALSDKTLDWEANPSGLLSLGTGHLKAVQAGTGVLTARLKTNPSAQVSISFSITASGLVPESLSLEPESLEVFADGPPGRFTAKVSPTAASAAVFWASADTTVATVDSTGRVYGKRRGETTVSAASRTRSSVTASARVTVAGPIPVEKVAFAFDRQDILVGVAESLLVTVSPPGSNPAVVLSLSDSSRASVRNGTITGTAAGTLSVFAASVANPAAKDTLIVTLKEPVANDTVPPGRPTVRVSPAGPTRERRPTWSWTSGGGGAGAYQVSLDRTVFDSTATSLGDTVYRPGADLGIGVRVLYVRERDAAGNWSQAGQAQVEIDTAGPSAPRIVGTSPTSALPRWTWSTGGGGGAGLFRARLADANFPADAPESRDTVHSLPSAETGTTYTLFVQERDAAGNWSPAASHAIKYDLTRPTVAILLPQASGTFITAAETVRVSGTSTGPNGIATLAYTLNAGAAVPMTPGVNGSWATPAITIPNAATSVIKVVATDNLGNTGEAQISVLRDSDPPAPPASLSDPASPTNVATASWTWAPGSDGAAGSGLSGRYRWRLGAAAWTEVAAPSAAGVTLAAGSNIFSVQEQDRAGNWSAAEADTVVLDNRAPDAVTFVGIDSGYTDDPTPTWAWSPSTTNGGIAEYVLKLGAGAEFTSTATSYTPATPLSDNAYHTLTVRQRDQVPGVVGAAKSFTFRVKVNPPAMPTVRSAVATLPNNGLTRNPGFTLTSGGGGNGRFRVKVNTETGYRVNGVAQATFTLATTDADGTYTVWVSEQDDLGRYGPEGSFTIRLDRTPPRFADAMIVGKSFPLRDNFITNVASLVISYTSDAAVRTLTCNLAADTVTVCSGTPQTDEAGNSATFQTRVWRRSRVVFFTPAGTGDGSSWEEAADSLQGVLETGVVDGKEFWLATGNYTARNALVNFSNKSVTVLGGFLLSAYPTNTQNRSKTTTILGGLSSFDSRTCTFDGLTFNGKATPGGMGTAATPAYFIDCTFKAVLDLTVGSNIHFRNCTMINIGGITQAAIQIAFSSTLTWDGGEISGNIPPDNGYGMIVGGGCSATFRNVNIARNMNLTNRRQVWNQGHLVIENSVTTLHCQNDVLNSSGATGSCRGTIINP